MIPSSAADAERQADHLRHEIGKTLERIAEHLNPSALAAEAMAATTARSPDWLRRVVRAARSPMGLILVAVAVAGCALAFQVRRRTDER